MALEDAINNLALAIREHVSVLAQTIGAPAPVEAPKETKKAEKAEKPAPTPTAQPTTAEPESAAESPSEANEVEPVNISETFFEKANELIQLDVEKAKEVLTELGFAKFKLVPANKHAKGLKLIEAQLNG